MVAVTSMYSFFDDRVCRRFGQIARFWVITGTFDDRNGVKRPMTE